MAIIHLQSLQRWALVLFVVALLAGVVAGMATKTDYTHYKGDTIITSEQYVQVVAENRIVPRTDYNYIEAIEGDISSVSFIYDFFSYDEDIEYSFLTQQDRGIIDNPILYLIGRSLREAFVETWYWMVLMAIIFGAMFYIVSKKPRRIMRFLKRVEHFIESKYYSKIKAVNGNIVTNVSMINLSDYKGIICVRCWEVDKDGSLRSVGRGTKWDKKELCAEKTPTKDGLSGVHAYRLGTFPHLKTKVMGIVELNGQYEYHVDGVVRAEHCKVFGLFMSKGHKRIGNFLSSKYELPLYFDDTPEQGYLKWLYSKNGIEAMDHNYEILKGD